MKTPILALGLALLAHAAPLRANPPAPESPSTGGLHVVVLGSSTAYGTGPIHPDSAWVNRFRADAQATVPARIVTNLALPGYTTYHLMPDGNVPPAGRPLPDTAHNITAAVSAGADAILINLPSNDALNGWSVPDQLANYDAMIAAAAPIPVWISTTQPRNTTAATRANLIAMKDSTLARWGDMAFDFWTTLANADGTINPTYDSGDGVHLNDAGHGILFARVAVRDVWGHISPVVAAPLVSGPAAALRVLASPNPFRDRTVLRYSLPRAGHVVLTVYDLSGRKRATLVDGEVPAGSHEISFGDAAGGGGVYFYRLHTEHAEQTGKLVRVR